MENEYLKGFNLIESQNIDFKDYEEVLAITIKEIENIDEMLKNKQLPDKYPDAILGETDYTSINLILNYHMIRKRFIPLLGYVLVSYNWINPLAQWIGKRKCLEIMSGAGALSYALKKQGVDIISTDDFSWDKETNWKTNGLWTNIESIDAIEAIKKYGRDVDIIIMSWADYKSNIGFEALKTMREINPNCLMIEIGENEGGCTADDKFYENMKEVKDIDFEKAIEHYPQWYGIFDYPKLVK